MQPTPATTTALTLCVLPLTLHAEHISVGSIHVDYLGKGTTIGLGTNCTCCVSLKHKSIMTRKPHVCKHAFPCSVDLLLLYTNAKHVVAAAHACVRMQHLQSLSSGCHHVSDVPHANA